MLLNKSLNFKARFKLNLKFENWRNELKKKETERPHWADFFPPRPISSFSLLFTAPTQLYFLSPAGPSFPRPFLFLRCVWHVGPAWSAPSPTCGDRHHRIHRNRRCVLRAIFSIPRGPRVSASCGLAEAPSPAINGSRGPPFFILSERRVVCHFVAVGHNKLNSQQTPNPTP